MSTTPVLASSNSNPSAGSVHETWKKLPKRHGRSIPFMRDPAAAAPQPKFNVVFVLGAPGSGKGTNCERLEREMGFVHLSAGELLREEIRSGSSRGEEIQRIILEGKIVPSEITVGLLEKAMRRHYDEHGHLNFLIDGFPRNAENNLAWEKNMREVADTRFLLMLDCPEDVIRQRLASRGRYDDKIEVVIKRYRTFQQETLPVIAYYTDLDRVKRVNSNRSVDEVYAEVKKFFADAGF